MTDNLFFDNYGPFTLQEIIEIAEVSLHKNVDLNTEISGVASLSSASSEHLTFFSNGKYLDAFRQSKAGFCITSEEYAKFAPSDMVVLISKNSYRSYALAAKAFYAQDQLIAENIAITAFLDNTVIIGTNCVVGQNVVIEKGAMIGSNCQIGHNTIIGKNVIIGDNARIAPNVVITHSIIKRNVIIHPGAKIGQDGFGFASSADGHLKVPQLGRVLIGNDVEIGANTTIDRGSINDTIIGDMTKIDNLVQIGHNVKIGKGCIIVAQVGISGSTEIGDFVVLGGQVGISGHIKLADFTQVAAQSGVIGDTLPKDKIGGTPAVPIRDWHRQSVILKKLVRNKNEK